jgi:hypothetical protein
MDTRYHSALFDPIKDKGILEGLILMTLSELGIDDDGLTMFRQAFELHRDLYIQATSSHDAEEIDQLTKRLLSFVPKYKELKNLKSDLNLNPVEWVEYHQEQGTDRNMPGEIH